MTICSNTIVKNGMPFIGLVLKQVEPFVDRQIVTISVKADHSTRNSVFRHASEYPHKVLLMFEDVKTPGELTLERQKQLDLVREGWVLFLDDDDYWPTESLQGLLNLINNEEDVDGYAFRPFQVIDKEFYDSSWNNKWFTKVFKKQPGVHYKYPWPRDLIYKDETMLYWKKTSRVVRKEDIPFFHLSYIKNGSFRNEGWAKTFEHKIGSSELYPEKYKIYMDKIYGYAK